LRRQDSQVRCEREQRPERQIFLAELNGTDTASDRVGDGKRETAGTDLASICDEIHRPLRDHRTKKVRKFM
jgi:hypothetical protein